MKDITITDSILYVGVDDKTLDLFESQYIIPNGVSYNSYVIMDEKITIMDTVDARKTDEWLQNVEQVLGANEARAVIAMQSTQYGIGGSGESADKKTTLYSEDKEIVKKISVNEMCYPLDEYYITSEFGGRTDPISGEYSYHSGTDMGAETGSSIYAALYGSL